MTRPRALLPCSDAFLHHRRSVAGAQRKLALQQAFAQLANATRNSDLQRMSTRQGVASTGTPGQSGIVAATAMVPSAAITTCPLDPEWPDWDIIGHESRQYFSLTAEERARCVTSRRVKPVRHLGALSMAWQVEHPDADDEAAGHRQSCATPPSRKAGHR